MWESGRAEKRLESLSTPFTPPAHSLGGCFGYYKFFSKCWRAHLSRTSFKQCLAPDSGLASFLSFTFLLVECLRVVDKDKRIIAHSPPFLVEENNIRKLQSPFKDRSGVYRTWGFVREPEHYTPLTTLKWTWGKESSIWTKFLRDGVHL